MANVGVGISGANSLNKKAFYFVREFVEQTYPDASIITMISGSVSAAPMLKDLVRDGFMIVGDAAHQTNPLTGGGIINAMLAGRIAGNVASKARHEGDISQKRLKAYFNEWKVIGERDIGIGYKIKRIIDRFSDEEQNEIARMLLKIPQEKRTALQIFKTSLMKHPKLVLEAARMFIA